MRLNFKKISAIATSVLLTGMSIGVAAAASYPAPLVVGSAADVAIVHGSGEGVSALDAVQSGNIQTDLQSHLEPAESTGEEVEVIGGDSFLFEKVSKLF